MLQPIWFSGKTREWSLTRKVNDFEQMNSLLKFTQAARDGVDVTILVGELLLKVCDVRS